MDTQEHGVFATRSPCRPNPIGLSCVRLLEVKDGELLVAEVDIVDRTPLLDIKPYVPEFDVYGIQRCGWFDHRGANLTRADARFSEEQ
jgi:tRNA-Thr(GGU) m(6)t(6)A37 methyltransferase TsaA